MAEVAIVMPKMSMTMEEGTMVEWRVSAGDEIKVGDVVCEVTTDKVDMEVEATIAGTLARIVAEEGAVVAVGEPIAFVTSDSEDLLGGLFDPSPADGDTAAESDAGTAAEPDAVLPDEPQPDTAAPDAGAAPEAPAERSADNKSDVVPAMPLARAMARELGIDLAGLNGTGPNGEVLAKDVTAAVKSAPVQAEPNAQDQARAQDKAPSKTDGPAKDAAGHGTHRAPVPTVDDDPRPLLGDSKTRRIRAAVNKVMNASAAIPQFTVFRTLDLSATDRVRKTDLGGASWTTLLVKAYAQALRRHPELNAEWTDGGVRGNDQVTVAVAVDTPTGLMVPVVRNADGMSLADLDREIKTLAQQARDGALAADAMGGATGSVSNLGGMGVESFNALLTPPQATALSTGSLRKEVVFVDGFTTRPAMTVGLTVDHRVGDGAGGARLLATIQEILDRVDF